ncbi:LysR family transcriptional regulator [Comamonas thiooxydans]|uniref:LysR family transcriptional regulator n=1 Tax=Comamonas thiooxydans TaxID=363952 RepID=A0AA42PX86_9BURK|nr:LysR family transcriptional regulator [Comamonas thiooxydans]MDH1333322.1 LysR family transcriptional regulator [Comamonas thiooxydans]MDH1738905.1 LysR family transcriptional regulator [Comamonas thiooxydans]MDH1786192.1 LysR family transcriptional regulator [Comamonas thiooxydans]
METFDSQHTDELATLVALADQGSFAAAGRLLARHPSVLSKRMQAFERRLGVRLVERTTRQLHFTNEGWRLVEKLRQAAHLIRDAEQEAAQGAQEIRGRLRLSMPATMGRRWISPMLADFSLAYPEVALEVEYSERIVDIVGERFDAAIRIGNLADSRLVATRLCDQYRLLCASSSYLERHEAPDRPADLVRHNCLGYTGLLDFPQWRLVQSAGKKVASVAESVRVSGSILSNDNEALLHAAIKGVGIIAGSDWHLMPSIHAGELVRILPQWTLGEAGGIYLLRPSGQYNTGAMKAFKQWVTEAFAAAPWRPSDR